MSEETLAITKTIITVSTLCIAVICGMKLNVCIGNLQDKKIKTGQERGITNINWWLYWGIIINGLYTFTLWGSVFCLLKVIDLLGGQYNHWIYLLAVVVAWFLVGLSGFMIYDKSHERNYFCHL